MKKQDAFAEALNKYHGKCNAWMEQFNKGKDPKDYKPLPLYWLEDKKEYIWLSRQDRRKYGVR